MLALGQERIVTVVRIVRVLYGVSHFRIHIGKVVEIEVLGAGEMAAETTLIAYFGDDVAAEVVLGA